MGGGWAISPLFSGGGPARWHLGLVWTAGVGRGAAGKNLEGRGCRQAGRATYQSCERPTCSWPGYHRPGRIFGTRWSRVSLGWMWCGWYVTPRFLRALGMASLWEDEVLWWWCVGEPRPVGYPMKRRVGPEFAARGTGTNRFPTLVPPRGVVVVFDRERRRGGKHAAQAPYIFTRRAALQGNGAPIRKMALYDSWDPGGEDVAESARQGRAGLELSFWSSTWTRKKHLISRACATASHPTHTCGLPHGGLPLRRCSNENWSLNPSPWPLTVNLKPLLDRVSLLL